MVPMANLPKSQPSPSNSTLHGPLIHPPQARSTIPRPLHTTLAKTSNLANLLPTGTVLGFQALVPSFSHNGSCLVAHKYLTAFLISFFALLCFLSSFTDTFLGQHGKLYYGIATPKGLYVFNGVDWDEEEREGLSNKIDRDMAKYRVRFVDFVHAIVSSIVFLVFAMGDSHVLKCYFRDSAAEWNEILVNVPLVVGGFASFLFMLFPTNRKGIGYADMTTQA